MIISPIERIEFKHKRVVLKNNAILPFDFFNLATGTDIHSEQTEGMKDAPWLKGIFDFYATEGVSTLQGFFKHWGEEELVINTTEKPISCAAAPLEFAFLADRYFTERGIRDRVDIRFVTPPPSAFTKPRASEIPGEFLDKKHIHLVSEFSISRVDNERKTIVSWDQQEVPLDIPMTILTTMGSEAIARRGIDDEPNFVPTHKQTMRSEQFENNCVIGEATDLSSSKA